MVREGWRRGRRSKFVANTIPTERRLLKCLQYQDLCEVFTDKLVAKIPSTATGKVTAINFGDDDIIPVGHVILSIEEEGEGSETAAEPVNQVQAPAEPEPTRVAATNQVKDKVATAPPGNYSSAGTRTKALSTPAVRHLAKKENVDINQVPGTGKNGRVTKEDILSFVKSGHGTAGQAAGTAPSGRPMAFNGPKIAPLTGITEQDS